MIISTEFPFIGASPDESVLYILVVGKGVWKQNVHGIKETSIYIEAIENDTFYLTKINNSTKLSVAHQYYYQIQTKIRVTKSNF